MYLYRLRVVFALAVWAGFGSAAVAQDGRISIRVVCWNMESGESNEDLLKSQMAAKDGVDIWGLSEVRNESALRKFEEGAEDEPGGGDFGRVLGTTGRADRLAILWNQDRFDLLGTEELFLVQLSSGLRAPLVAHFRGKTTGQEFKVMVNHLARGNAGKRHQQATMLNQWVRTQALPVIAMGDFNFDYHCVRGDLGVPHRDKGFNNFVKDGKFLWIRPDELVKTQASRRFNTVLDFVFVANVPFGWSGTSRVLRRGGDSAARTGDPFADNRSETDHRPVEGVFTFRAAGDTPPPPRRDGRAEILAKIRQLEEELARLRGRIESTTGR